MKTRVYSLGKGFAVEVFCDGRQPETQQCEDGEFCPLRGWVRIGVYVKKYADEVVRRCRGEEPRLKGWGFPEIHEMN